jgi:lactoylglutathione lyase
MTTKVIDNKNQDVSVRSEGISIGFEVESLDKAMQHIKTKNIPIIRGGI